MATAEPTGPHACPYPGLRPFRRGESRYFCGRDDQIARLTERLRRPSSPRLLAVLGPSGCGKTSLIEAGVIPALRRPGPAAAERWKFIRVWPGPRFYADLADELVRCFPSLENDWDSSTAAAFVADDLGRGPMGLIRTLEGVAEGERANLLLVVDPFEELVLDRMRSASEETRAAVALLLASACEACQVPVHVVLVLRADFLGECALLPELARAITDGAFIVPGIARESWADLIKRPAEKLGGAVAPDLLARLLADMDQHRDQLPLLQHLLMRVWRRACRDATGAGVVMTLQHYEDVGGFDSALSRAADEVVQGLADAEKPVAEAMFRLLSARQTLRVDLRRPVLMADLEREVKGVSRDLVRKVVHKFHDPDCGLITPQDGLRVEDENPFLMGHECLISGWKWLNREVDRGRGEYDVFLCHNSEDKPAVREIGSRLRKEFNLLPWLDEWELRPGMPYQEAISARMETIRSIAVIIGRSGTGPWQRSEVNSALRNAVERACPVIPVILRDYGCGDPDLPPYLKTLKDLTWVDFRETEPDPWKRLVWGITGDRIEDEGPV